MGIHPFQISDLNWFFLGGSPVSTNEGSYASEFAIIPDNLNANLSRYMKLQAVWANISVSGTRTSPDNDSFGQSTGLNDNPNGQPFPCRPNGGYFVRGLYFTNTAIPSNDATGPFRVGYIGSFVAGMLQCDYGHDTNGTPVTVDYGEPVYNHGASGSIATGAENAAEAKQWRDPVNPPSDGTDLITNSSSVLTRTAYMPQSYFLMHIDSTGSNTLGSGNVTFHFENRPTLKMAGFSDAVGSSGVSPNWSGANIPNNGAPNAYPSDPLAGGANVNLSNSANDNFHEMYQVTGVRKLNSRGLSFHLAKYFDNGANAYAYPFEEDGITLGTGVVLSGNAIQYPFASVNDQQEYTWAGGRDQGALITFTAVTTNVLSVTTALIPTPFTTGQVVLMQGLTTHPELNGALLTVLAGATTTSFTANWTHANYASAAENGIATAKPDFRIRQHATFTISEEYYGTVMDTKCAIWSNKSSMFPLVFVDLADTWTTSVAKRIAGVAVVPYYINATQTLSYQLFFLSEDGKLAIYDFTLTNGVLSLGTSAPAVVSAGEAYGAFNARSTTSTITNIAITANVLTVTAANTFEAGEIVNLQGLTTATFLNNQTVTVATAGGGSFTASYTHANYGSAADTGTAVGYSLWAVYGTMSPDPRLTQTALVNTARVGVVRYLIGSGVWGSVQFSPLTARHNGRSLQEMIVARDSKLYMLVEDVTVTGSFNVSNAFAQTFPSGPWNAYWQVIAIDATVPTAVVYNASKVNGTTLLAYGTNVGAQGITYSEFLHFWFHAINGQLHDLGTNKIVIQPNWTVGQNDGTTGPSVIGLQVLDVSGATSALANANLTTVTRGTILPNDSFIISDTEPATDPVTIVHARDFATNAERTVFWLNKLNYATFFGPQPVYLAPPSYSWGAPTALSIILQNSFTGVGQRTVNNYQKDFWTVGFTYTYLGQTFVRYPWTFPTMLTDNYIHYINGSAGDNGLPAESTYGRSFGQGIGFLPTYWKFTGGNWKMADSWADAAASPRTVSAANTNIPLPYGLQVQFGQTGASSYSLHEFATWNVAWGNTKFARKMRQSYAQFAGQTFVNQDTRTVATQNALSMFLIDTDLGTTTNTAPTSATPQTATLAPNPIGWVTQTTWPKLDTAHVGFDTTPYQTVWNVNTNAFDNTTFTNPPAANVTGSNPYTWTVGATTYTVTANGEQVGQEAWLAVNGNPNTNWHSNVGGAGWVKIDLTTAQTVRSYSHRPLWTAVDALDSSCPKSWTLEGSATGAFAGEQTIVDTRTNQTPTTRGVAYNVASPGSFRYYRFNISTSQTGTNPSLSMLRLNTAVLVNTVNFNEMVFYAYGSNVGQTYFYRYIRNWQMARGIKLETSIDNGTSYTPVFAPGVTSPTWRALNGYVWTFPRQTNVTNVRITVQHGYNYATGANSGNVPLTTGFGPFYFIDYGVSQATLDNARLGSSVALDGTAPRGSFDPNCLGMAVDVPNISIDGSNPSLLVAQNLLVNTAVHGFWSFDFVPDAAHSDALHNNNAQFKLHPFFGFILFQGAGGSGGVSTQTGTSAVIEYQWGRRV